MVGQRAFEAAAALLVTLGMAAGEGLVFALLGLVLPMSDTGLLTTAVSFVLLLVAFFGALYAATIGMEACYGYRLPAVLHLLVTQGLAVVATWHLQRLLCWAITSAIHLRLDACGDRNRDTYVGLVAIPVACMALLVALLAVLPSGRYRGP